MSTKLKPEMPAKTLAEYTAAVKATPGAELKGASMPYTSMNGNMYSFLDKKGLCALRLGKADREAFNQEFATSFYVHETGAVMQEYVTVPPSLLGDLRKVGGWFKKSLAYAKTLKPKATTKKSTA
jgi:TfoX/Sxy family transcriptional regulator of competence genes